MPDSSWQVGQGYLGLDTRWSGLSLGQWVRVRVGNVRVIIKAGYRVIIRVRGRIRVRGGIQVRSRGRVGVRAGSLEGYKPELPSCKGSGLGRLKDTSLNYPVVNSSQCQIFTYEDIRSATGTIATG